MKVFIADDEHQHLFLLELFLKKWGYEVRSMDNGEEALQSLQADTTGCIAILDWEMPRLTGPEVTARVRLAGRDDIYIILLTAKTQAADRAEAAAAGIDLFMAKPYEPADLRKALAAATQQLEAKRTAL